MSVVEIFDEAFRRLVPPVAPLNCLHEGMLWAEGPVWFADGQFLLWSDVPNNRLLRWVDGVGVHVYRAPSRFSNGNTRDRQGRLVSCEQGERRVTRTEPDGRLTVLAERHAGKRLNSPNDVVVAADGALWFTDPTYGILSDYEGNRAEAEQAGRYVYRIDPQSARVVAMVTDFVQPNGLAFSPSGDRLYVADSGGSDDPAGPRHIRAFTVGKNGCLHGGEVLVEIDAGVPDGLRIDRAGRIWSSAADGVHCYTPDGRRLGKIRVPEIVSNLEFGGERKNDLFITATSRLYRIRLGCQGL